jgi:Flp pilus assembly protein TadG
VACHKRQKKGISALLMRRCLKRLCRDTKGVTSIEFAFVFFPFLTIIFAIIETALSLIVNRTVDNAVIEAARMIRTGQATANSFSAEEFADQICTYMPQFLCKENRFVVSVTSVQNFSDAPSSSSLYDENGDLIEDNNYTETGAGDIVVVNVVYRWPMFTSMMSLSALDHGTERHLSTTAVFRNEPWD